MSWFMKSRGFCGSGLGAGVKRFALGRAGGSALTASMMPSSLTLIVTMECLELTLAVYIFDVSRTPMARAVMSRMRKVVDAFMGTSLFFRKRSEYMQRSPGSTAERSTSTENSMAVSGR